MFLDTPNIVRPEAEKKTFAPLPAGWYRVMISNAIGKDTAAGTGRFLQLTFDIIEGDFTGRKVWNIYNVANPNETAVRIGKAELKALVEALDHKAAFQHEQDLLSFVSNRVVYIKLGQRADKRTNELRNTVLDYRADADFPNAPTPSMASSFDIPF
jgi:hypothetical protein